jgi:hypothetical protein
MKTFEPDWPLDAWDVVFSAMRCGELKPGELVRVWDQPFEGDYRDAGYVVGRTAFFGGQPSVEVKSEDQ